MGFKLITPVVIFLIRPAKNAFPVFPFMLCPFKTDIPRIAVKDITHGIFACGVFGTVHGAAGQVGGQFSYGDAVNLVFEYMIYPLV
jgi:hypothetical protein